MGIFRSLISFFIVLFIISSCTWEQINPASPEFTPTVSSCEKCHTDYALLQEVYTPDTAAAVGGCGGDAPHYEPFDRVFMGNEGFTSFKQSGHYNIGCTGCHNGVGNSNEKDIAHSGQFISHPSLYYEEKCGICHQEIVANFGTSLHQGTGQKRKVAIRSGFSGPEDFDQLPQHQIEGYNNNCAHCHGTCGNCHVVRPAIGGGGLIDGHQFNKTPDMLNVCVTCHVSRGGHAYLGVASGTKPDVHLTSAGLKCIDCHEGAELHGDGQVVQQRYAYDKLPQCEDCHSDLESENVYHSMHYDDFNCQVCHSQDYNNCGSCHIHGDGARVPSYLGFKIAKNPIPDVKQGYKSGLVLVRRTLAAPDNWERYGVSQYSNFDALPTYNYTSPHNLLRWTDRTQNTDGGSCSSNCHIREAGGALVNKELYLLQEDLLDWELNASSVITVDEALPASWPK